MLEKIYDLRDAKRHVAQVQDATLHSDWAGLVPEHGLLGSDQWWAAVSDGRIRVTTVTGKIARVFMSGHNDYPEFEIDDGVEITQWTREGPDEAFVVGRPVQLDYVLQRFKKPLAGVGPDAKIMLRLYVEASGA